MIGSSRSPGNVERVRSLGAKPVVLDLLDPPAVLRAVIEAEPEAIVHEATALALDHDGAGIYNIVDEEPAPVREWLPVLADALGAKPPRHFPRWLARLFAGDAAVMMGTSARGASNAKAKRELGWELRYPSWREGFAATYAATTPSGGGQPHPAARARRSPP